MPSASYRRAPAAPRFLSSRGRFPANRPGRRGRNLQRPHRLRLPSESPRSNACMPSKHAAPSCRPPSRHTAYVSKPAGHALRQRRCPRMAEFGDSERPCRLPYGMDRATNPPYSLLLREPLTLRATARRASFGSLAARGVRSAACATRARRCVPGVPWLRRFPFGACPSLSAGTQGTRTQDGTAQAGRSTLACRVTPERRRSRTRRQTCRHAP